MSLSKPQGDNVFRNALKAYIRLLKEKPVLTKACTSAFTSGLGCFISQLIVNSGKSLKELNWRSVAAYATVGFVFIGPSVHHFHSWMEQHIPKSEPHFAFKRLLLDRLLFSPSFLLTMLYLLSILEGQTNDVAVAKIKEAYWPALKMNWKVWTPLQFINVKYIPQQYRAPFMSVLALLWTVYISVKRSR